MQRASWGTHDSDGEREMFRQSIAGWTAWLSDTGNVRIARLFQATASRQLLYVFALLSFWSGKPDNWDSPLQKLLIQKCLIKPDQAGCIVGLPPRVEGS
ncbi:MAG: hypothetical protein WBD81_15345 [Collimonas pratensis]|uniref:hypothetical protein n=1 Tax=Collimonas pratensis TaxID=279113 RepID=UPI003C71836C